jgi:hypothetical protein
MGKPRPLWRPTPYNGRLGADASYSFDFNRATGRFDRSLFFANWDAVDEAKLGALIKSNSRYCNYLLRLL